MTIAKGLFITGSDTEVGKTEVTLGLIAALQREGRTVLGMKPVAAGCTETADGLRNEDAERIRAQASVQRGYENVNPYAFAPPIAPHIAAEQSGTSIVLGPIEDAYQRLAANADWVLVEGVGGWRVPLGPTLTLADLPKTLELPVLLVVGLRLGCLNHALLSAESIIASGLTLAGWAASHVDPEMAAAEANVDTLRERLPAPCIGVLPWLPEPTPDRSAEHLNIAALKAHYTQSIPIHGTA